MATLAELLLEHDIRPRHYSNGTQKLLCPECSHTRKSRTDPCLSLTIDDRGATWLCHHCEWKGSVSEREKVNKPQRPPRQHCPSAPTKPRRVPEEPTGAVLAWLANRGISEATARRNRIGAERCYVPTLKAEVDCIAFPYFRGGDLVNIKYRALA
jgi:twinkle protein